MSLLGKKWVIQNEDENLNVIAKLLKNRGIDTPEKADQFFKDGREHMHNPLLLTDISKAMERIRQAVENKERIMIFGDYDVDGITGTAILYDFFKTIGVDVHYTLPNRENDGYGLKDYFIKRFKEQGVGLVITVDCGTSNLEEIKLANELEMDTVVTDHHSMPKELPPATAVVNPHRPDCKYPNKEICGSSIAYKLIQAMAPEFLKDGADEYLEKQLSIVSLGVVGDCMSLTGENRVLVREGLKSLMAGNNPGVLELLKKAGVSTSNITSLTIGFQIGPRINAAGRLDTPDHAFELLIGNVEKAAKLNELNEERKVITRKYLEDAAAKIESMDSIPNIIVLHSPDWRAGLLGLIASNISDRYNRPTIAMQEKEGEFVASMRSVNDFDITGCLRENMRELFSAFGGHAMAGGFTMPKENLKTFLEKVEAVGKAEINPDEFVGRLNIDCEIQPNELSFETRSKMDQLEPFGQENPEPTLLIRKVQLLNLRPVGKDAEHLQISIKYGDKTFSTIAFRFGQHLDKIDPALPHDMVCNLEVNEWNGNRRLQLRVVDLKPSE
jgi:single-stranded-DNA-specific exonuclease